MWELVGVANACRGILSFCSITGYLCGVFLVQQLGCAAIALRYIPFLL